MYLFHRITVKTNWSEEQTMLVGGTKPTCLAGIRCSPITCSKILVTSGHLLTNLYKNILSTPRMLPLKPLVSPQLPHLSSKDLSDWVLKQPLHLHLHGSPLRSPPCPSSTAPQKINRHQAGDNEARTTCV